MRGYSLIEVMLVTLLITVLGAMSWPALQRSFWQQELYRSADLIYTSVRDTRMRAITSGQEQWFGLSNRGELCFWSVEANPSVCPELLSLVDSSRQSSANTIPEFIHITTNFTPIPAVRFSALNGMAGFSAGRFEISHERLPNQSIRVITSTLGRIRTCIVGANTSRYPRC